MRLILGSIIAILIATSAFAQSPILGQPFIGENSVLVQPDRRAGYTLTLKVFDSCLPGAASIASDKVLGAVDPSTGAVPVPLGANLQAGNHVCVVETYTLPAPGLPALDPTHSKRLAAVTQDFSGSNSCSGPYNDCNWGYTVVGGVEQSDLSSQTSQTDGFVELFIHSPPGNRFGSAWLQARFLGAPSDSNTQNIAATATDPSGTVTSSTISSVGYAVDYTVGYEVDFRPGKSFTLGPIVGFGATTPLSSQSATIAYAVPDYGTNECNQLHLRFTTKLGYDPPLPDSGSIQTMTTTGSSAPVPTSSSEYCVVNDTPITTVTASGGVTTTTVTSGTQITNIAFSPQDRSSFLLKYVAGLRLISRFGTSANSCQPSQTAPLTDDCNRSIVDFTLGQDASITGGLLRKWVLKSSAIFPIPKSGVYVFLSASNRLEKNKNSAPLILTPTPLFTGTGTPPTGSVVVPSPSVFLLPLKQSDRDFYRIGIAIDLARILPKLFAPPS